MKSFYTLAAILFTALVSINLSFAQQQPTVLGSDAQDGSTYRLYDCAQRGAVRVASFLVSGTGTNTKKWEWFTGTASSTDYSYEWRPYFDADKYLSTFNTKIDPSTSVASARYNHNGGVTGQFPATGGDYYTWIVGMNSNASNYMSVLQTTYTPVSINTVTQSPSTPNSGQSVAVTATLSGTKNSNEHVYIRYTTNSWSTSSYVEITSFSSNQGTANIPSQTSGTAVQYYVLSTEQTSPSSVDIDYYTLNLNNNGGSNYSYTVSNIWTTAQAGNWSNSATWAGGVPPTGANVVIAHNVTLDAAATIANLTINSGKTFTASDGSTRTLTVQSGGVITNSGTFTASDGTISFAGAGSFSGTAMTFNNVTIAGGVNFSGQTIGGTLQINGGGFVSTTAPTYGTGSTLKYNTNTTYGRNIEWSATTGAGYPYHVQISNNTTVDLGANSGTGTVRQCAGNLTVDAGSTLSLNVTPMTVAVTVSGNVVNNGTITLSASSGGDLNVGGNFTDNNTFTGNNRAIFFTSAGTQVLSGSAGSITIPYVVLSGTLQISGINLILSANNGGNGITFNTGAVIDLNGSNLTISRGTLSGTSSFKGNTSSSMTINDGGNADGTFGPINFVSSFENLQNLTINRSGTAGAVTLGTTLTLAGSFTLTAGTFTPGSTLNVKGNWTQNGGSFVSTGNTLTFNGVSPQTLGGSVSSQTFNNFTLNNSTGLTLSGVSPTVNGTLTISSGTLSTGANTVTLGSSASLSEAAGATVSGNITTTRTVSATTGTETFGNIGADITLNGTALQSTTVLRVTGSSSSGNGHNSINRTFTITPTTNTGLNATLAYHYDNSELNSQTASTLSLYKTTDNGAHWSNPGGTVNIGAKTITVTGQNDFSKWTGADASDSLSVNYLVTASTGANGSISPSGSVSVPYGGSKSFTISPNADYSIDSIYVDGAYAGNSSPYVINNVTANHTISAVFKGNAVTITASAGSNGTIDPSGSVGVAFNGSQSFTMTGNTGYHLDSVYVDGSYAGNSSPYNFTAVTTTHSIRATFAINTYTLNSSVIGSHGVIYPVGDVTVDYNGSQHYSLAPDAHYHVDSIFVNGGYVSSDTAYTVSSVQSGKMITAKFAIDSFTIAASAGTGGGIAPNGTFKVAYDSTVGFAITASSGYHIDSVVVDGDYIGAVSKDTLKNISANHTIIAKFAVTVDTITVTAGAHGSISPSGPSVTVNEGGSQAFTISALSGYHTASVVVDDTTFGELTSYTFTNVHANHTISATFVSDTTAAGVVINGTIAAGEYGSDVDGQNQQTTSGVVWHMTWDADGLYIGISGAPTNEGAVLYLDKNPKAPINSGTNADGTNVGQEYDITNYSVLQFRADLVSYVKNGYREYRTANGSNGWSGAVNNFGRYADNGSNVREYSIPWSAIGGEPASFAFFGYLAGNTLSNPSGYAYGQVPTDNPSGVIGTSAIAPRYYIVNATDGSVKPFSRNSYVYNGSTDITGFGGISVYDFTLNTAGRTITRASGGGGAWTIGGTLNVNAGTVDFGSSTNSVTVNGDVLIGSTGTLKLSTEVSGDLNVKGNLTNAGGTFTPSSRAVGFIGTAGQTVSGVSAFDYMLVDNTAGVTLGSNATVNQTLTLSNGLVTTGSHTLTIGSTGSIVRTNGYVAGNLAKNVASGSSISRTFEIGDATTYAPVTVNFASVTTPGTVTAATTAGSHPNLSGSGIVTGKKVNRYWTLTSASTVFTTYDAAFTFATGDIDEGANTNYFGVRKYDSPTWSPTLSGTRGATSTQAKGISGFSDFAIGELPTYPVTASAGTGGSISPTGAQTIVQGDSIHFAILPNTGFSIDSVVVDGSSIGAATGYTFTNVQATHSINAYFKTNAYVITVTSGDHGTITPGTVGVSYDSSQTFTIAADAGYHIDTVYVDGASQGAIPTYTFTHVTTTHTISAVFAINTYTLNSSVIGSHGVIYPVGDVTVDYNGSQHYSLAPDAHYHVDSIFVNGGYVSSDTAYTVSSVQSGKTITAKFAIDSFTIAASAGTGGGIAPNGTFKVAYDSTVGFAITASSGYHIDSVVVDGDYIGAVAKDTLKNISANHTIVAKFAVTYDTITVSAGAHGSISPAGPEVAVAYDASQTFDISANSGYHINDVLVDGGSVGAVSSYQFTHVVTNHTISATFVSDTTAAGVVINGTIASGEYGSDVDGQNQQTSGVVWHMTWDADGLYIGISGAPTNEGAVLYLDKNPKAPINSGTNADGTNVGQEYDITNYSVLQFRADLVSYVKNGYREYRTANGSNGWSGAVNNFGRYADNGSNVREYSIPWSAIGGEPTSFAFFGYLAGNTLSNPSGYAYGQVPTENPSTVIGTSAIAPRYYIVNATDGSVKPFSRNSYVYNGSTDITGFGGISVYDFTLNTAGRTITRASGAGGAWTIGGTLNVNAGTVDFGSSTNSVTVNGDVLIGSTGTLKLSTEVSGDLNVKGNLTNAGGTFTPSSRAVGFIGTAGQTVSGVSAFDYVSVDNAAGVTLGSNATVNQTLTLSNGLVTTGSHTLTIGSTGSIVRTNGYVAGNLAKNVASGSSISRTFEIGDATTYAPVTVNFASVTTPGTVTAATTAGSHPNLSGSGIVTGKKVNRYWTLTSASTVFTTYDAAFTFGMGDIDEGANANYFVVRKFDSPDWTAPFNGTRTATSTEARGMTTFSDFAVGEAPTYTFTASAGSNGTISPSGDVTVVQGDSIVFSMRPATGYHVDTVYVDGIASGSDTTHTFRNVTAGHTVSVVFAINAYTITATAGSHGAISPSGSVPASSGGSVEFTMTPDPGYHLDSIYVDNVFVSSTSPYTISGITADHAIHATFAVDSLTLTISAGMHGTISPTGTVKVAYDSSLTFTLTPDPNYHVDSIFVDGSYAGSTTPFILSHIHAGHSILARFALDSFTVAASAGTGGAIDPSGTFRVAYDSTMIFTISANTGYHIDSVIVNGTNIGAVLKDTLKNISANQTIVAKFAVTYDTIMVSAGAHGSISPSGPAVPVVYDASQTFNISANSGYHISDVLVDGGSVGALSSYQFTHVIANHTISAIFVTDTSAAGVIINGTIAAGEYGSDVDGQNQQTTSGIVWHMTWDSDALYIGISGAPNNEGAVLYLDKNPKAPINSGTNADGTNVGQEYDITNYSVLQFRADLVSYVKNGYREYRTANGSNGWSGATTNFGQYADNGSNVREYSIPWSAVGGEPTSFAFFGYLAGNTNSNPGGYAYGQAPTENPSAVIGTSAIAPRYYIVNATDGSVKPFSRNSYVYNGSSDITSFGGINVYDFTLNTAGRTITRASGAGGAWTIGGTLNVNAGTVDFGSSTDNVTVNRDVLIGSSGSVILSTNAGGDLNVKGNLTNTGGTLTPNNRAVGFTGAAGQTISGIANLDYVSVNNNAGVALGNDVTINKTLTLTAGPVITGSHTLTISGAGSVSRGAGYVTGNLAKTISTGTAVSASFELGDAVSYAPAAVTFNSVGTGGVLTAATSPEVHPNIAGSGLINGKQVNRYWTLANSGAIFDRYNATFTFTSADIANGADPNRFAVRKYDASTWTSPPTGARSATSTQATGMTSFSDFAVGEAPTYTITASAGANGAISPSGAVTVVQGDSATFTMLPGGGYHTDTIYVDESPAPLSDHYTFAGVTASHTIRATFAVNPPNTHEITATAGSHGMIDPAGHVFVLDGGSQAFSITPDPGYHILSLLVDGGPVTIQSPYTFTDVIATHTISVTFAIDTFKITATAGANGTITPSGAIRVNYGDSLRFHIRPSAGFHIDTLTMDGSAQPLDTTYIFRDITADHSIHAGFLVTHDTITATAGTGGGITPSGAVLVAEGSDQQFVFNPNAGHQVDTVYVDGFRVDSMASYTFKAVEENHAIHVVFKIITYTINTIAGANGSITPAGPITVAYGGSQQFIFHPLPGYAVSSVLMDGQPQTVADSYTFTDVTASHTLQVTFGPAPHTITATAGVNGSISPSGAVSVADNSDKRFTFGPYAGYHVDSVIVDGSRIDSVIGYTFHGVTGDHTIRVVFAINLYDITATAGANGSISPSGVIHVPYHGSQEFTISAASYYIIDSVVVDGHSVGAVPAYTFSNVAVTHTIEAYFKLPAVFETKFRTFIYDSLCVKKAVAKKALTEYWRFVVKYTGTAPITEVNVTFHNEVKQILTLNGTFASSGSKKNWKFSGSTLHQNDSLVVIGRSTKAKPQMIDKLWFGAVTRTPGVTAITPKTDYGELPMPNVASARDLAFLEKGFATHPWVIGIDKSTPDSSKYYGWVAMKKNTDMFKSLITTHGQKHARIGHGFDLLGTAVFKKKAENLPPNKHDDKTFADLLTLEFNIILSDLRITQNGFGELRYNAPASFFGSMLVRDIAHYGDSMMTYQKRFPAVTPMYASLDSALGVINGAFASTTLDTTSWSTGLVFTGVAKLADRPFLVPSGVAPVVFSPEAGFNPDLVDAAVPEQVELAQNYPNPFNPVTNIQFTLPNDGVVTLSVYNILGQEVARLLDHEPMFSGTEEVAFNAGNLASGVYFYRLTAAIQADDDQGDAQQVFTLVKKMMVIK